MTTKTSSKKVAPARPVRTAEQKLADFQMYAEMEKEKLDHQWNRLRNEMAALAKRMARAAAETPEAEEISLNRAVPFDFALAAKHAGELEADFEKLVAQRLDLHECLHVFTWDEAK